ncbi:MAG: tRNA dimethylallyltransferase [Parcubacteria group bacterium GW2011_GWA2_47_16]|nr:MAG: tRNA dimethylallyltransferase [Parcubacteria group bacterium GW2011_GWA2_47_16]
MIPNSKVVVILGPTATGKSALAVKLAKKLARHKWGGFNGAEIISADSRQIYKGLDIGTGKITEKEMAGVPHHLLDVVTPKRRFTVVEYQKLAREKIAEIFSRGHLPIICGGTGFYISALVDGTVLPDVPPNPKLRAHLKKETSETLFNMLLKLDPRRAKTIDPKNSRRLIRAIEIAKVLGKVPNLQLTTDDRRPYEAFQIGLTLPPEELKKKIAIRLFARIREGMITEAERLHKNGLLWKRMEELGLEYKYLALFLQNKISKSEMLAKLQTEIWHYAKRQMTWFKRNTRIKWFKSSDTSKINTAIQNFL